MPTKRAAFAQQTVNEIYGVVVGLYGDPANQKTDGTNTGTDRDETFTYVDWFHKADSASAILPMLFWSRLLIVELLVPFGTSNASRLAFVARPRSLWLYYQGDTVISDFVGHTADPDLLGKTGDTGKIVEINPPYRFGDVIRIGTLPAPITLSSFADNFQRDHVETYDGTQDRTYTVTEAGGFNSVAILGSQYAPSLYTDFPVTNILFYDKNVEARTRIVGGGTDSSSTVTVTLCIGGVNSVYQLNGKRIS